MTSSPLDNLVKTGHLKTQPIHHSECEGLIHSGLARLKDASNKSLSMESRFDLAYNAAHSLALAALRFHGYRPSNRYIVFQALPHTLGVGPEIWRVLAKCHDRRNLSEYEGHFEVEEQLFLDLLNATFALSEKIKGIFSKSYT